jgi:hypothetical protein
MSETAWIVMGLVVVAVVVLVAMGGKFGWLELKLFGKSGLRAGAREGGASAIGAKAKRDVHVEAIGEGKANADRAEAGRDVRVRSRKE